MKNQWVLVGNVGQKPELKQSKNGKAYLQFSVAVNERYKPKDATEYVEKTVWFNLVAFDKKAENLAKILDKGTAISVTGKLGIKVEETDGKKRYLNDLIVDKVDVVAKAKEKEASTETQSFNEE